MKPGEIVMIYTDPMNLKQPEGQAKLMELITSCETSEYWRVEFLDSPGKLYPRLIKKT